MIAIRGATSVEADTPEEIRQAVGELMRAICEQNSIAEEDIVCILLFLRKGVPRRGLFVTGEKPFDPVEYRLYQMEPELPQHKYHHKDQQNHSDFFQRHVNPHFLAKRLVKKSVNSASSVSWDT